MLSRFDMVLLAMRVSACGAWLAARHEGREFSPVPTIEREIMVDRIIDTDIARYTGEIEEMRRRMRRCAPSLESYYRACIDTAQSVFHALIAYRAALDAPHPFDTELEN